jgi:hypothetical protein
VWPGTHYDTVNDVQQYNLVLSAGGIFWPASDPVVSAQADVILNGRLSGVLDAPTAQALMLAAVISSVASTGSTLAADLASTATGKGTALIGDFQSAGTLASKLNEIGSTSLPTVKTEADATHYGIVKLSTAPAVANTPIAAGINDPAITGAFKASTFQLSQNHPLVAGTVTVATLTFSASAKVTPIRNNPDAVAAHWGSLSITAQTPGAPGSITVTSSNAADTSSVDLLILDV